MRIKILATGGTIASKIDPITSGAKPALSGEDLVAAIPGLDRWGKIEIENVSNISSDYEGTDEWVQLANRINEVLNEDNVQGVVVTHGTDTLEETAYFLELTVRSQKPVVVTGAQRNVSELDTDGPRNLLNAVKIVSFKGAMRLGVLVALNGQIHSARDVTKSHTHAVETFNSGRKGLLGEVVGERIEFYRCPLKRLNFNATSLNRNVEIINMYAGNDGKLLQKAVDRGLQV